MKEKQIRQIIKEELDKVTAPPAKYPSIQKIEKDLKDRESDIKQLDLPDEIYEFIKSMMDMLPPDIRNSKKFQYAFKKMYMNVMKPNLNKKTSPAKKEEL